MLHPANFAIGAVVRTARCTAAQLAAEDYTDACRTIDDVKCERMAT